MPWRKGRNLCSKASETDRAEVYFSFQKGGKQSVNAGGALRVATKDNRIKYNLLSGVLYQVVLIALSFLLPRLYLENFGSEVNGVLSSIKQIFVYMFLLESGV